MSDRNGCSDLTSFTNKRSPLKFQYTRPHLSWSYFASCRLWQTQLFCVRKPTPCAIFPHFSPMFHCQWHLHYCRELIKSCKKTMIECKHNKKWNEWNENRWKLVAWITFYNLLLFFITFCSHFSNILLSHRDFVLYLLTAPKACR